MSKLISNQFWFQERIFQKFHINLPTHLISWFVATFKYLAEPPLSIMNFTFLKSSQSDCHSSAYILRAGAEKLVLEFCTQQENFPQQITKVKKKAHILCRAVGAGGKGPWSPLISADQLTLYQPGANYAHLITTSPSPGFWKPSYGSALWDESILTKSLLPLLHTSVVKIIDKYFSRWTNFA